MRAKGESLAALFLLDNDQTRMEENSQLPCPLSLSVKCGHSAWNGPDFGEELGLVLLRSLNCRFELFDHFLNVAAFACAREGQSHCIHDMSFVLDRYSARPSPWRCAFTQQIFLFADLIDL